MNSKKIIYDIGSNNGDDIPYYLLKSDLVVAVEANPRLCDLIKNRFKEEIKNGSLVVENCVVQINDQVDKVPFYIAKNNHVLSQYPKPSNINDYEEIYLPSKDIIKIIKDAELTALLTKNLKKYRPYIIKRTLQS
jgi:hypothetical protein|tara:strand:- start:92 stop:496 length:405 start_codon:yes stop_codon:yes gene_type:complete